MLDEARLPCGLFSWRTRVSSLGRHALAELNGVPTPMLAEKGKINPLKDVEGHLEETEAELCQRKNEYIFV